MRLNLINMVKKIIFFSIIFLVTACGKTDFSGSWTIDIKGLKDIKEYQSADADGKKLIELFLVNMHFLIDGNKVAIENKICEIKEFDQDAGVVCPDGNNFGLFIKGSNLFVKFKKGGELISLVKLQVEKKVNDTNASTPVKQDESPPVGVWVSGDEKIIVTKEKFGKCKWLTKPPIEETQGEVCNNYFEGLVTKAGLVKEINEFYANEKTKIKNRESNKEELNLSLSTLKNEESKTQSILNQIIDMPLKIIAGVESASGDCSGYYFIDSKNLYSYDDCQLSGNGIFIKSYSKQN